MNKQRKLILIAVAVGIISTFLPWISISAGAFGYHVNQSTNGFHGIGVLYFILLVAIGVIAGIGDQRETLQKNMRLAVIFGGVVSLICILIAFNDVRNVTSGGFGVVDASIGYGFILSFLAAIAVTAIPFIIKQPGESLASDIAQLKESVKSVQTNIANTTTSTSAPKTQDKMAELEKLINWRNEGKITEQEYEELKSKII